MVIYNLFIFIFGLGIYIASVFSPKALKWLSGRKDWKNQVECLGITYKNPIIIHCASLGEYEMARPIVRSFQREAPEIKVLVSFFSPSGFEHAKLEPGIEKFYLPLDTRSNMNFLMSKLKPSSIVFIKYDLWFNLIDSAKKSGCSLHLVNYRPKPEDLNRWHFGKKLISSLKKFDSIYTLTPSHMQLLGSHGIDNVETGGDSRYGNVLYNAGKIEEDGIIDSFSSKFSRIIVCGSIWKEDWQVIDTAIDQLPDWGWIIAPHVVDEGSVKGIFKVGKIRNPLYYTKTNRSVVSASDSNILVLDCIGKLFPSYSSGKLAYVGGGFKTGLHNIIEPAAFGLPVAFGPNYGKFPEAEDFIANRLGQSIKNTKEFLEFVERVMEGESYKDPTEIKSYLEKKAEDSYHMYKSIVDRLSNRVIS